MFHLAASWRGRTISSELPPPLTTSPVLPKMSELPSTQPPPPDIHSSEDPVCKPKIRVAAAQMVFASRSSQDFITPEHVLQLENWTGQGVLEALRGFDIAPDVGTIFIYFYVVDELKGSIVEPTSRSWQRLGIGVARRIKKAALQIYVSLESIQKTRFKVLVLFPGGGYGASHE